MLYLGTAAGDGERAQLKFMLAFTQLGCEPQTLPFFPYAMHRNYAAEAMDADLIYVGGGNTVAMLAVWRAFGFHDVLYKTWLNGTVLAGISAGANCWFERYVTDSVPGGGEVPGLAWLPGTFCPHLDSENWRLAILEKASVLPAFGAPDGVLMRFGENGLAECVADRNNISGVRLDSSGQKPATIPTRLLM